MLIRTYIFIILSIASGYVSIYAQSERIEFKITRSQQADKATYRIRVSFTGDADGTTEIHLPDEWGGQRELFKSIRDLRVTSPDATVKNTPKPHIKTVEHRPGSKVTVEYNLVQDFEGPLTNGNRYRPVTDRTFIHWIGNTIWVLPDRDDSKEVNAAIEWKDFPANWTFANSFATGQRKQKFKTKFGSLRSSLYVGGDFRLSPTVAAGKPVSVLIRGKWHFADADLAEMIRRVVESQRSYWNDHSQDYFLVTLVPIDEGPNSSSFGGTGLTDSFALFATANATVERIRGLLSHEYSHNWIPTRMGRMPDPEQQLYWFSEGFNEFYTYKLLHRSGIISELELITAYNERIREYYMLPVRTATNDRIIKDFWNDRDVQQLPYLRGFLFATNLNAAIKKASGGQRSLDDAMFELYKASGKERQTLSFESLASVFGHYLGNDPTPMMKRYLQDGELIAPDPNSLGDSAKLEMIQMPVFELGFDFDKFAKEKIVAGVDPNSSAYDAGLRDGQQRAGGVSFRYGDTTSEIELKVKDAEGEKTVKYLPVAKKRLGIPQFSLK